MAMTGALRMSQEYAAVYSVAGRSTAGALQDILDVTISFDQVNDRAVYHMQQERLRYIRGFTAEQRKATRRALVDGLERGLNPLDQARNFRSSVGLTDRQQSAVINFRRMLEEGDSEALTRRLRDKRFDSTISRSIREKKPLTKAQIDKMTARYSERYVKYRSEVIGRTEALRAVHSANDEMYRQAVDLGEVSVEQLERTWVTAHDSRVRDSHSALGGVKRRLDESWEASGGSLGDTPGTLMRPFQRPLSAVARCQLELLGQ